MKTNYLFLLVFTLLFSGCTNKNQLTIVKNQQSDYEIVIAENPAKQIEHAAKELQNNLEKISSVTLPVTTKNSVSKNRKQIEIFINDRLPSAHTVSIKTEGDNLLISGGNAQSALYAVYELLETELGCKWFSPEVEKIPELKTVSLNLPLNYLYTPEITTRTVHSKLYYDNYHFADKQKVTHEAFPNYVPDARVHTFHRFVPEKVFGKDHPEYYALRGNKRLHTQLCLTNEEVLQIVKDSVRAYFGKYPDASVISVSSNDNTQYCECEHCSKIDKEEGSNSATMIRFVNEVAREFPDKMISTLAYQYTRKPCKTKPLPNVLITLCSIECDRSAPIEEKCSDFAEDLMGWKELSDNIRIWDYTTQFTNFLAPFPNIHTLQPNIQFFRDNHAKWIFEQHSHNPSELFELRSYLTAKLLWNPDRDANEIINEFVNGYYKEAGVYVKMYIDAIHEEIQKDKDFFLFLYGDPAQGFQSFLSPENLKKYNSFFDEAEKAVADQPGILKRVRIARISTDYASLGMARNGMSPDFQLLENGTISEDTRQRLNRFESSCKAADITLMNEMGYRVDEFLDLFNTTLKRAASPNIAAGKTVKLLTQPKKYANENPQALTDKALGGSNFYANWLGFEGNNLEAVIDLDEEKEFSTISTGFLQVTNHIVFFPKSVSYSVSTNAESFQTVAKVPTKKPITPESKRNDIEYFTGKFKPVKARYIKIKADNVAKAPAWHNAAGLPVWIFADEVIVN
ncbi:DUF4838 domain-containing protein [Prolixibacteraceae bacterium Z1-6]|uniref:DUF4838 domain-containing protein n=1 Tax=Draconibacterium aestuarii TaxID=2998507 RepID=A0A9X3FA86_9BACT|nr:DUF4838 domain-containing protein [Prolixibacteraceae bacterium Z1-6]